MGREPEAPPRCDPSLCACAACLRVRMCITAAILTARSRWRVRYILISRWRLVLSRYVPVGVEKRLSHTEQM
ncbi:hypothetical protein H8959_009586 [Pygathrix nigripes]